MNATQRAVVHLNFAGTVAEKLFEPLALYDELLVLILKPFASLSACVPQVTVLPLIVKSVGLLPSQTNGPSLLALPVNVLEVTALMSLGKFVVQSAFSSEGTWRVQLVFQQLRRMDFEPRLSHRTHRR
jgi:hypothetical protein